MLFPFSDPIIRSGISQQPAMRLWQWWHIGHIRVISHYIHIVSPPLYPLVNIQKAIENGHKNSGFFHWTWWFSIVLWQFARGYHHFCWWTPKLLVNSPRWNPSNPRVRWFSRLVPWPAVRPSDLTPQVYTLSIDLEKLSYFTNLNSSAIWGWFP